MKTLFLGLLMALVTTATFAQKEEKDDKIINDSAKAKQDFLKDDPSMSKFFESSFGYIILPNVGKGGLGVGAASGNGAAYEGGALIGFANMTQVTVGFQAGGQA